ncbi:MAG TPA: MgtC/SapB family protein [Phycisphaerales bacterium]|nr:MgtC/SapB family protein [Phycisphaerales bacterium]
MLAADQLLGNEWLEIAARLLLAAAIGGVCGWEREKVGRAAGLRTHMMVAIGSAGFTMLGIELLGGGSGGAANSQYDPTRVLAGIVTGIGFLGAGTIIQTGGKVTGLTTAAGLWTVAAAGAASGAGAYRLAMVLAAFTVVVLAVLKVVEHRWFATKRDSDSG